MKEYKYKFSVIIPIYNVELYLAETIDSVIDQTIGFKDNIQMILVNDGSPDNSEKICLEYAKKYPENIIYVKQENAGVSAARNTGIPYAEGKYINFLDSDDKWDSHAFKKIYNFFEEHYNETDVVAGRIRQFDANTNYHVLDYKFKPGMRVADLTDENEFDSIQLHVTSAVIKAEAIGNKRFDSEIKFGEDSLFINSIILDKVTLGLGTDAMYHYRKRRDQSSAVQTQTLNKEYYFKSPQKYYYPLVEMSKEKFGTVIPYIQNVLAYDMGWRLGRELPDDLLNEQEKLDYQNMLSELYAYIDDSVILKSKVHKTAARKMTAKLIKDKSDSFFENLTFNEEEHALYHNDIRMITLNDKYSSALFINIAKIKDNCLTIEGLVSKWVMNSTKHNKKFVLYVNDVSIEPELKDYPFKKENTFFGYQTACYHFKASIELGDKFKHTKNLSIKPTILFDDMVCSLSIKYGKFVPNYTTFVFAYKVAAPYYMKCYRTHIRVTKPSVLPLSIAVNEAKCLTWLLLRKHRRAFLTRILYILFNLFIKGGKKIWLISDRSDKANDNGEAFFKYAVNRNDKKIKPIFCINKGSDDVERLKKIGKVIYFDSFMYPYYFLSADKVINSSGGEYALNPFGAVNRRYLTDLMNFDFVFLQHGVIMNDLSSWLHKFNKNISLFVTSTNNEYKSIANTNYLYTDDEVILTGLARFDELKNEREKLVIIIPTWRRSIKESYDSETKSVYFDGFKETDYFKFYNSLINDERLLTAMKNNGYKGLFCLHPIHKEQHIDFEGNDVFKVNAGFVNYKEVFSKSALLITDYSSVAFDFAYLRKPIIYSQFDKEDFFEGQIFDQGYFSFEKDGMGPVCTDLDSTVKEMISLINNDCAIEEKYKNRVDSLFAFNDKNSSQRIYDEILKLDK